MAVYKPKLGHAGRPITKRYWETMRRHGYTSKIGAQRYILALDSATGATMLDPVIVCDSPKS